MSKMRRIKRTRTAEESAVAWREVLKALADLYELWAKDGDLLTGEKMAAADRLLTHYDKWLD